MKRSLWLLPVAFLAFIPTAQSQDKFFRPALTAKAIDASLRTDWYGVYHQGTKIGYFSTARERVGDTVVESANMNIKLVAFGKKSEMVMTQTMTFEGATPFRLLGGVLSIGDGNSTKKITVKRLDTGFDYIFEVAGTTTKKIKDDPDYTLADAMASSSWIRTGPKVDDTVQTRDIDLDDWKIVTTKHKVLNTKTALVKGVEVKYFEVESISSKEKIPILARCDAAGKILSGKIVIFDLRLETEEQAKNTKYSQDLFVLGNAKIDRGIGSTKQLKELVLEVDGKEGASIETGPWQTVVESKPGTRTIKIGKGLGKEMKPTAKEIEEALSETNDYPISNVKIKALARLAVGDAKTPEDKVEHIVHFVRNYIDPKLTASLPNIHDLLDTKRGDCKSFALLTTNLCRASGIPSREVAGLLYMGDDQKAFGGHAWNEVVLNGVWVPVDATLNEVGVDAGHICLGEKQGGGTKNMLESLGKLSFRVVEVKSK